MTHLTIGEEVLLDDVRYVVSAIEQGPLGRVRLLATTRDGVRFRWVPPERVHRIETYLRPVDDTARLPRRR